MSDVELVVVTPSFDELVGKYTQEETRMMSRGRIQNHEEGEIFTFNTQEKNKKSCSIF